VSIDGHLSGLSTPKASHLVSIILI
jgi:hypothetical protein